MPDLKVIPEVSKIIPKDLNVKSYADSILAKTEDDVLNADTLDIINDISVLRAAKAIIQDEIDGVQPQVNAIQAQIDALYEQANALVASKLDTFKSYEAKIKFMLSKISPESNFGVDPSQLNGNAGRFVIQPKTIESFVPARDVSIHTLLNNYDLLRPHASLTIPKKLTPELLAQLNIAVGAGHMIREVSTSASITDTVAAVNRFTWDEAMTTE